MSKATKRKHVTKQVMNEYVLPSENQSIVKVLGGRGNNLHEVEDAEGQTFLVSMPTKFRKNVWIKRGDYVLTEPITEGEKVKAEIVHILYSDQIRYIKSQGKWPPRFTASDETENNTQAAGEEADNSSSDDISDTSDSDSDSDLFVNTNRPQRLAKDSDVSEESSSEDGDH